MRERDVVRKITQLERGEHPTTKKGRNRPLRTDTGDFVLECFVVDVSRVTVVVGAYTWNVRIDGVSWGGWTRVEMSTYYDCPLIFDAANRDWPFKASKGKARLYRVMDKESL